jgi:hypothetical protein
MSQRSQGEMTQRKMDGGHIGQDVLGKATHDTAPAYIFCH